MVKVLQKATAAAKAEGKMEVAESMLDSRICFEEIYLFTSITEDAIIRRIEKNHEREIRINPDLEMRIKEWRYKHFKALNILSYMVMSDKTLQEIANRIPHYREDRYRVSCYLVIKYDYKAGLSDITVALKTEQQNIIFL